MFWLLYRRCCAFSFSYNVTSAARCTLDLCAVSPHAVIAVVNLSNPGRFKKQTHSRRSSKYGPQLYPFRFLPAAKARPIPHLIGCRQFPLNVRLVNFRSGLGSTNQSREGAGPRGKRKILAGLSRRVKTSTKIVIITLFNTTDDPWARFWTSKSHTREGKYET